MIGMPQPDLHKQSIAELSQQIDDFMRRGRTVTEVPPGASAHAPHFGTTGRTLKLRMKRDTNAPAVRDMAAQGMNRKEIAAALGLHVDTVALIGKENSLSIPLGQ
jgi:DNA invertase Pin-like site-specific DNA recombinase